MARIESWFEQDLQKPVVQRYISGNFFSLDNVGNLVGVKVYDNGAEAVLSGSVTGYCVLADGTTVPVSGTRSGNQAYILLPQSVLSIPGYIGIALKLTDGSTITTLLSIIATVYPSRTDTVITPSQQVITDWSQQISAALQEVEDASAAQDAKIDDLKSALHYVESRNLLNINDADCEENSAMSGVGTISEANGGFVTGFIPVAAGKTYIFPFDTSFYGTTNYGIPIYKSDKSYSKSQSGGTYSNGYLTITITGSTSAYMRVRGLTMLNKDNAMVVEGDTYPSEYIPYTDGAHFQLDNAIYGTKRFLDAYQDLLDSFESVVNWFDPTSSLILQNTFISGTAYAQGDGYAASCPIPVRKGVSYKFPHGSGMGSTHRGFYVDSSGTYLDAFNTTISGDYETFTSAYDGFVAVNLGTGDYSHTMFCETAKYPESYVEYGSSLTDFYFLNNRQIEQVKNAVKQNESDPLFGKTAVFDGDSICAANTGNEHRGWALRIIQNNDMAGANVGVGGATITQGTQKDGVNRHWISAYIETIHTNYPSLDYYIFDGGTNDADLFRSHPEKKGTFDPVDFSGDYDEETFCGAFETLIFNATSYYPSAKIGYIIPPKMGPIGGDSGMTGYTAETNRRRAYFDTAIEICKKWGVPYIDLWDSCPMNPSLLCYYNASDTTNNFYADGQHPTAKGYDLFTPPIEAWMKSL